MFKPLLIAAAIATTTATAQQKIDLPRQTGLAPMNAVSAHGIVWLKDVHFREGILEVDLRGKDVFLKSFLGLAFHGTDTLHYENICFRPFNFRHPDTARHHWMVQYTSMPDAPYDYLRKNYPYQYENIVNPIPDPNGWFHATIVVSHGYVTVFVNHSSEPSLQIKAFKPLEGDLLGLWADGLDGDFANLAVAPLPGEPLGTSVKHGSYTIVNRAFTDDGQVMHMDARYGDGIAWLDDHALKNGSVEFDVRGQDIFQGSFVGLAFHGVDDTTFEAVYFRPFNFRSEDSGRRAHSVQYVAAPAYGWRRLRTEFPGKYENPVALSPDDWFHVRIQIQGDDIRVSADGKEVLHVQSIVHTGGMKVGLFAADGSGGDWRKLLIN